MEPNCIVCKSNILWEDFHYLNNGSIVHKICFDNLAKEDENLFTPIKQNRNERQELQKIITLKKKQLFWLHFKKLIFINWREIKKKILSLKTQIKHFEGLLLANNKSLESLRADKKNLFKIICDYYPDYPPDWAERKKQKIREVGQRCQICKRYQNNFHLHHEVALGKWWSNLPSNLMLLCQNCHHKIHRVEIFKKWSHSWGSQKIQKRLQIIQQAISTGWKISFYYIDREKVRTKRIVAPDTITKWIIMDGIMYHPESLYFWGYCFIDKDYRNFKIERIEWDVEITESVA